MPLVPLSAPTRRRDRIQKVCCAVPVASALGTTLLVANAIQMASLTLRPFSRSAFRSANRWLANTWWGWCVTWGQILYDINIIVSGDDVPMRENAIVVANHQDMADIPFLMNLAIKKDRLGDMKWFVKKNIKYVPGVGWGMVFLDCLFVERQWMSDHASIEATFKRLIDDDVPVWLITFIEGTRVNQEKLANSQAYALSHGLKPLRHVLTPRTKGFVASVQGLRTHIDAVYDITIGYENGVPNLWQYIQGLAKRAHLHVRRYPINALPQSDEKVSRWIHERFVEKDELLEHFYRHGSFPSASGTSQ
ncbi:MAG: hypothetical protein CSA75_02185 [Sorangium cellulosum]|nr:MAG: hypothetical protein CSA75_02185 [Sorangium cellulosum]